MQLTLSQQALVPPSGRAVQNLPNAVQAQSTVNRAVVTPDARSRELSTLSQCMTIGIMQRRAVSEGEDAALQTPSADRRTQWRQTKSYGAAPVAQAGAATHLLKAIGPYRKWWALAQASIATRHGVCSAMNRMNCSRDSFASGKPCFPGLG